MKTLLTTMKWASLAFVLCTTQVLAQEIICSGNITLTTQAQVDAFPATHGCNEITGMLLISGNDITNVDSLYSLNIAGGLGITGNAQLTNIDGLSNLSRVGSSCNPANCGYPGTGVAIRNNPLLSNVTGLSSLATIAGDLVIASNASLSSISGLGNLASIGGVLEISNCDVLPDLNGLFNVSSIGRRSVLASLRIEGNASLISINGLKRIKSLQGPLSINNNASLPNLEGLDSLTEIAGVEASGLSIGDNSVLTNIDALSALTSIRISQGPYTDFAIASNPSLENLNGLSSLIEIKGGYAGVTFRIINNDALKEVDGLSALQQLTGFRMSYDIKDNDLLENVNGLNMLTPNSVRLNLVVTNNPNLAECCGLYRSVQRVTFEGSVTISGNGAGCTKEEILANGPCQATPACSGDRLPSDKNIFVERSWGYAPHATNIIVQNYEPGITYELQNHEDSSTVAGPEPGNIGLYVDGVTGTTTYHVLAKNSETGCQRIMSTLPVVNIIREPSECTAFPEDKDLFAESNSVSPGGATNILVIQGADEVVYTLRNDVDDAWVAGPYPSTVGLYTSALNETTTFNVLAINQQTGCSRELTQIVTISVDSQVGASERIRAGEQASGDYVGETISGLSLYPNPSNGEFDVVIEDDYTGLYYVHLCDLSGKTLQKQIDLKEERIARTHIDLKHAGVGIYILSVYYGGKTMNKKLIVTN
jgi:hypothetical protein